MAVMPGWIIITFLLEPSGDGLGPDLRAFQGAKFFCNLIGKLGGINCQVCDEVRVTAALAIVGLSRRCCQAAIDLSKVCGMQDGAVVEQVFASDP